MGAPEREVIAIVGDGGLQMTIQEFGVIMQNNVGVKILLLNNEYLGMVRQWQQLFFEKRYASTHMANPNFQLVAQGFGIECGICDDRANLKGRREDHDGA